MQTRLWVSDSNVVIVIFGNRESEVYRMQARLGPLLPREVPTHINASLLGHTPSQHSS